MAVVDPSSVDVPLSLFSSLDTELSPATIPEGISPDNQDVVYLPGSVSTRPGLQRVFVSALEASGTVVYEKSFVLPTGAIKNLYFTNDGILWVEDVTNNPGVATNLFASTASMASSVTAFGREYIALSDGKHGADVPIQYDGKNLWRVTQDAPGAPPTVQSIALPSSQMAVTGASSPQTVVSITSSDPTTVYEGPVLGYVTFYTSVTFVLSPGSILPVSQFTVAGNTNAVFNTTFSGSLTFLSATSFKIGQYSATLQSGTGGTLTNTSGVTITRSNNIVSVSTATAHNLRVGYQAQITNVPASTVGTSISSIIINNEATPGIGTITTSTAHGLSPNSFVNINNVTAATVGTAITNVSINANVATITMSAAHGLQVGSVVTVACSIAANAVFNGQWYVTAVPSTTTFCYALITSFDTATTSGSVTTYNYVYSAADAGTVTYAWPLANANPALNYFTVLTAPTATTFTVAISYTDGTWSGGTVTLAWNGIFYVLTVPSSTTFTYQQYGPNASSTSIGTVTPYGQMTPGIHQIQQCFLFQSGAISAPSPPATFVANGGQYPSITNLAIGPSNVAGRVLLFTGAGGAYFFYIPQPAQVNGVVVSTATQINDNTTTSTILDFADATLYAATGCSIPGNNLAAQVVLGPCAGFFTYSSRLQVWGEYNKVQNLVNTGFDGGYAQLGMVSPLGWSTGPVGNGVLYAAPNRPPGFSWVISTYNDALQHGLLSQAAYEDAYGNPILEGNQYYSLRVWLQPQAIGAGQPYFQATITSVLTGFSATAQIPNSSMSANGGFVTIPFSTVMPATIPPDMILTIYGAGGSLFDATILVDELELIFIEEPYLDHQERFSYVDNPEGFDGLTGVLGPEDDLTPIMNHGVIRNTLYIVTGNAVHETSDNGGTEPSGWNVEEVDDECGAWSIASVARNEQGIGSAGKGFMAWSGPDGAHVFTGRNPEKCSQEIQSIWDPLDSLPNLTYLCWTKNDQKNKRIYFGIPLAVGQMQVLVLDYRNLATDQIGSLPPVHISFTGKMIASDLTRKWTKWNVNAFCGELMYRSGKSKPQMVFGGVNNTGGPNAYTLNSAKYSDDDFGQIFAYYTTYFFVSHDQEQAFQLGSHRKDYDYLTMFIPAIGTISATPLLCSLTNAQPATPNIAGTVTPGFDLEIGINVVASRCAFKIAAAPLTGQTDSYFSLQKLIVNMKRSPWQPVRGSNGGSY